MKRWAGRRPRNISALNGLGRLRVDGSLSIKEMAMVLVLKGQLVPRFGARNFNGDV